MNSETKAKYLSVEKTSKANFLLTFVTINFKSSVTGIF